MEISKSHYWFQFRDFAEWWILPIGGAPALEGLLSTGPTPSSNKKKSFQNISVAWGNCPNHKMIDSERILSGLGQSQGQISIMESDLF